MSWIRANRSVCVLAVLLILIFSALPLGTAIQFGGDEGYELMKALLMTKGFTLYKEIWSDQPPLFTVLLASAFRLGDISILPARCVTIGFGLILFIAMFVMVRQRSDTASAWFAVFFLIASPVVLELSISAMQEVPSYGLAMLSVLLLFLWGKHHRPGWLWGSGAAFGLALQIKFLAALVLPAIILEAAVLSQSGNRQTRSKSFVSSLLQWSMGFVIVFGLITWAWGDGSLETSVMAHFTKAVPHAADLGNERPADFAFSPTLLLEHADCTFPALLGVYLIIKRRKWRQFALPVIFLFTVLGVHLAHRPWWPYYYLHLAIPLAWLAGLAAGQVLEIITSLFQSPASGSRRLIRWKVLLLCALVALPLARSFSRLGLVLEDLRQRPKTSASQIVAAMKKDSTPNQWVYADNPIYAFHAGLPMPPELAVVTLKRFWSGQITNHEIVQTCAGRGVEQVVLSSVSVQDADWTNWLATAFAPVVKEENMTLYRKRRISPSKNALPSDE